MKLTDLKGLGEKKKEILNSQDIYSIGDLIERLPVRYEDRSNKAYISQCIDGMKYFMELKVIKISRTYFYGKSKTVSRVKAGDGIDDINLIWYNDRFSSRNLQEGESYKFFGQYSAKNKALLNPKFTNLRDDSIGGIYPIYSLKKGISQKDYHSYLKQALDKEYLDDYFDFSSYNFFDRDNLYKNIHLPDSYASLIKAKISLAARNLFLDRLLNYQYRSKINQEYISFKNQDYDKILLDKLPFKLTDSQKSALEEIKSDMAANSRMNRILIGDVGSGKTVLAILSAFIAVKNAYQVAFMAPTEILAIQHYKNFKNLLEDLGLSVNLLLGSTSSKDRACIYDDSKTGRIDILFGTHSLFQDKLEFKNLGLVILDEQQRFGVIQRKKLSDKGLSPDILLLSATPIPRTMALLAYKDLGVSYIEGLPEGRQEIVSYLVSLNQEKKFIDFAHKQVEDGRQVYIIASRVEEDDQLESVERLYPRLKKYLKDVNIDILHGKMTWEEKVKKQTLFLEKKIDILIATSIVEVGIDVKNANTIIIYDAWQFGLSQLHQLRGRVGRGPYKSYCFFVGREADNEKLSFIVNNRNGFEIAAKDLELRGSGKIYGPNQSGFMEEDSLILPKEILERVDMMVEDVIAKGMDHKLREKIDAAMKKFDEIILN